MEKHEQKGQVRVGTGRRYVRGFSLRYILQKEAVLFVLASIFKARLERKMGELPPDLHGTDLEEQKLRESRVLTSLVTDWLLHRPPLALQSWVDVLQSRTAVSAFLLKAPSDKEGGGTVTPTY